MKQLISIVVVLFSLIGCLDDQTKMGENAISYLSFKTELDTLYYAERNVEFVIEAPEMKQERQDKALSYEWQINYKVVSTERVLTYAYDSCGLFPCRLKVYNEDGAIFKEFKLRVPNPYDEGLLLFSKYDGHSIISFRNDNWPERGFEKDVYALNNAGIPLGTEPVAIVCSPTEYYTPYIYLVTENPFRFLKLDYYTMQVLEEIAYPEEGVDRILEKDHNLYIMTDGKTLDYDCHNAYFRNNFQQGLTGKYGSFPDAELSDRVVVYGEKYHRYLLAFDMKNQVLFSANDVLPHPIKDGDEVVEVDRIYGMLLGVSEEDILILLEDKNGQNQVVYLNISEQYVNWSKVTVFEFKSVYPAAAEMNGQSVFASSTKENILYYSVGNEIYRYNYLSAGNFPTQSDYTVGVSGSLIKKMILDEDKSELYVAVDAPNGEYRGAVYCYDVETKGLKWKEEGVAGKIVEMLYKPRNRSYNEN